MLHRVPVPGFKIFHGKPRKIIHPSFDTVTMDPSYCLLYKISQLTYSLNFLEEKTLDASQKMHHKHCVLLKINLKRPLIECKIHLKDYPVDKGLNRCEMLLG